MFRLCLSVAQIKQGETAPITFWTKDYSGAPIVLRDEGITPAYLTGDTGAESVPATWEAVTDGSFRITINDMPYNIDGIDFTGDTTMDNVAATIQAAIRALTEGLETVVWSSDHFVITTVAGLLSAITVTSTSTGTVGTDISGAGGSDWMDADSGVVTDAVQANAIVHIIITGSAGAGATLYDDDATIVDADHGEISINPGDTSAWELDDALVQSTITKDSEVHESNNSYIWIYPS